MAPVELIVPALPLPPVPCGALPPPDMLPPPLAGPPPLVEPALPEPGVEPDPHAASDATSAANTRCPPTEETRLEATQVAARSPERSVNFM
jgi:hypothetical protein